MASLRSLRSRIGRALQTDSSPGTLAYWINLGLAVLIVVNIADVVLESVPALASQWRSVSDVLEFFSLGIFSIEYLTRLWVAPEQPQFRPALAGRIRYALTPMALIDLLSILPSILLSRRIDLRGLRIFRLVRLVRLIKLGRHSDAFPLLGRVIRRVRGELASTAVLAGVMIVAAASMLHLAEGPAQPQKFGTIPDCMWWAVTTMTTVGYGDVYPITPAGRILGSFVSFLGIGLFALPTGILGAAFVEEARRRRDERRDSRACPHCGGSLDP